MGFLGNLIRNTTPECRMTCYSCGCFCIHYVEHDYSAKYNIYTCSKCGHVFTESM